MAVHDVYLFALHEPYRTRVHPVPINATIVHALTLRHPRVPQPDGGLMYRCLTEFPGRVPRSVVPISTLTFELNGGRLWHRVGDWERVVGAIVDLARTEQCDAMPIGLPPVPAALLAGGPHTVNQVHHPDGTTSKAGPAERQQSLDELTGHLHEYLKQGPLWPGDDLVPVPEQPSTMPYKPTVPRTR